MKLTSPKVLIPSVLVLIGGLIAGGLIYFSKEENSPVREIRVEKGDLELTILSTGDVKPETRLDLKPPLAGRADSVLVREGDDVNAGQVLVWLSSSERAALLDVARGQSEADVKRWEQLYRPIPVVAPLAGTIILRSVEPGQTVGTGDTIIAMSDRLLVKAPVDETDLAQIKLKQRARVVLDAYPKQVLDGTVHKISYEAKSTNNVMTYIIDVVLDVPPDFLRSGMTANVTFISETRDDVLIVPNEAIRYQNGNPSVTVKEGRSSVERLVKLGLTDGKSSEVLEGLREGEVVLAPTVTLQEGAAGSRNSPFSPGGRPSRRR